MYEVSHESDLAGAPADVWAAASCLRGVNRELGPWLRMSGPQDLSLEELRGRTHSSWLLLLGVLPYDRHRLGFESIEPGRGFAERSSSWTQRAWWHDRTLEPLVRGGTRVTDRVRFEPRVRLLGPALRWTVDRVFRHRHRRLRRRFGTA